MTKRITKSRNKTKSGLAGWLRQTALSGLCKGLCKGLLLALSSFVAATGQAEPFEPRPAHQAIVLKPEEALNRAWKSNAVLRQLRREYARAAARLKQAGLLPNPELGWVAEDFAGSAAFTDDRFTQFTLEWIQTLPLSDRLSHQRRLAELELELLEWQYRLQLVRLSREVSLEFNELRYLGLRLELAQEALANARKIQTQIEARVQAGKLAPLAALQARQQTLALESETLEINSQRRLKILALAGLWGDSDPPELNVSGSLPIPQKPAAFEHYASGLNRHPQLARWQPESHYRQEFLQAAQSQSQPDLTAAGGVRYHPPADWGLIASVNLPIALYNQNQGAIEDARLRQASLASEREQDLRQLSTELRQAYQAASSAYIQWELKLQQLQLAKEEFRMAVLVFEAGKSAYLEILRSQQSYFELRRQLLESLWQSAQARISLQSLTQDFEPGLDPVAAQPVSTPDNESGLH